MYIFAYVHIDMLYMHIYTCMHIYTIYLHVYTHIHYKQSLHLLTLFPVPPVTTTEGSGVLCNIYSVIYVFLQSTLPECPPWYLKVYINLTSVDTAGCLLKIHSPFPSSTILTFSVQYPKTLLMQTYSRKKKSHLQLQGWALVHLCQLHIPASQPWVWKKWTCILSMLIIIDFRTLPSQ